MLLPLSFRPNPYVQEPGQAIAGQSGPPAA